MPSFVSVAANQKMENKKGSRTSGRSLTPFAVFIFLIAVILQLIDYLVVKHFPYSVNSNLIFGVFAGNFLAIAISILILVTILFLRKKLTGLGLILITGGLISNLMDRIIYSGVIDYFTLWFIPKFNTADLLIVAGAILLGLKIIRRDA